MIVTIDNNEVEKAFVRNENSLKCALPASARRQNVAADLQCFGRIDPTLLAVQPDQRSMCAV